MTPNAHPSQVHAGHYSSWIILYATNPILNDQKHSNQFFDHNRMKLKENLSNAPKEKSEGKL